MFDLNWRPILWAIVVPIQIKHSSVAYQQATHQKYNWRGHESPSGYGLIVCICAIHIFKDEYY